MMDQGLSSLPEMQSISPNILRTLTKTELTKHTFSYCPLRVLILNETSKWSSWVCSSRLPSSSLSELQDQSHLLRLSKGLSYLCQEVFTGHTQAIKLGMVLNPRTWEIETEEQ